MLVSQMGEFFSPTCQIDGERAKRKVDRQSLKEVIFNCNQPCLAETFLNAHCQKQLASRNSKLFKMKKWRPKMKKSQWEARRGHGSWFLRFSRISMRILQELLGNPPRNKMAMSIYRTLCVLVSINIFFGRSPSFLVKLVKIDTLQLFLLFSTFKWERWVQ